ncbi:MAG: hypothetical protein ACI82Z_000878 [Cellvibrionaceae bacterium]|jgi:uncharacterized protein (DUF934 family)
MPNKIIKDGKIIDNYWHLVTHANIAEGQSMVPLQIYLEHPDQQHRLGVCLENEIELEAIAAQVLKAPLIAIEFPVFTDGRGFSLARLLRQRYNYEGEIRAVGHVIRDQLCYLQRCGFNAFELAEGVDLKEAAASLQDFSEFYQGASDQPLPLFKRR